MSADLFNYVLCDDCVSGQIKVGFNLGLLNGQFIKQSIKDKNLNSPLQLLIKCKI